MAFWRRQPEEPKWPAAPEEGVNSFKKFYDAGTLMEVQSYPLILDLVDIEFSEPGGLAGGLQRGKSSPRREVQRVLPTAQSSLQCTILPVMVQD